MTSRNTLRGRNKLFDSPHSTPHPNYPTQNLLLLEFDISDDNIPGRRLTPHCCWYQREGFVFLTVEVMDCQDPDISVLDDKLLFTCEGAESGKYELDLQLLHDINTKESRYAVRARVVEFRLVKMEKVWWERLLREKARQHWLRVDFQNWKDEEDVGEESEPFEEVRNTTLSLISL